ncbi:MAG: YciI family protein [Acidimicrobiales bacterium]
MAQYLALIYENEASWATVDEETYGRIHANHMSFGEKNHASLRGGETLEPSSTATFLHRNTAGDVVVTDGPFAETKEVLGGYYVIDAPDLDAALAIAKQIPAEFGGVEIRPIRPMS